MIRIVGIFSTIFIVNLAFTAAVFAGSKYDGWHCDYPVLLGNPGAIVISNPGVCGTEANPIVICMARIHCEKPGFVPIDTGTACLMRKTGCPAADDCLKGPRYYGKVNVKSLKDLGLVVLPPDEQTSYGSTGSFNGHSQGNQQ